MLWIIYSDFQKPNAFHPQTSYWDHMEYVCYACLFPVVDLLYLSSPQFKTHHPLPFPIQQNDNSVNSISFSTTALSPNHVQLPTHEFWQA